MHRIALVYAKAVNRGTGVGPYAHGVDHEGVAFPTADRIAHGRRHQIRGVGAVQTDVANIVALTIKNGDVAVVLRQHLKTELHREGERRRHRPALVLRIWTAPARGGGLSFLFHTRRGFGLENWIVIIPHQLAGVAGTVRTTDQIPQRLRARWHRLEIECVLAPANPRNA